MNFCVIEACMCKLVYICMFFVLYIVKEIYIYKTYIYCKHVIYITYLHYIQCLCHFVCFRIFHLLNSSTPVVTYSTTKKLKKQTRFIKIHNFIGRLSYNTKDHGVKGYTPREPDSDLKRLRWHNCKRLFTGEKSKPWNTKVRRNLPIPFPSYAH